MDFYVMELRVYPERGRVTFDAYCTYKTRFFRVLIAIHDINSIGDLTSEHFAKAWTAIRSRAEESARDIDKELDQASAA